jgi:hypothetical protein
MDGHNSIALESQNQAKMCEPNNVNPQIQIQTLWLMQDGEEME